MRASYDPAAAERGDQEAEEEEYSGEDILGQCQGQRRRSSMHQPRERVNRHIEKT